MTDNIAKKEDYIISAAHEWASDVIGFAAKRLNEMSNQTDHGFMLTMDRVDIVLFMKTYMDHLLNAYEMQLTSLTDCSK